MNTDDLEQFEAERELQLANEYQDVVAMFKYAVETDRRFYLANAWVWDMYRKTRLVPKVRVLSFKDLNIEELPGNNI